MSVMTGDEPVAVVTGGSSGIGAATVEVLVKDGFRVVSLDLTPPTEGLAELSLQVDVTDVGEVDSAFATITSELGRLDVMVNNAGITGSQAATTLHETPVEEWDKVFAVNVRGVYLCTRAALPVMMSQGSGHVITTASAAGLVAFPGRSAYTASKGAALMLAKSVAVDYARHGIRSNAVCPGMVRTPMTQWRLDIPELRAKVEATIPFGRVAE
ncbi:MAG: meso-butanediol dehydrogenase / (S,S)-butanediol dehydrogenase / diacetyl reductase, partial [Actinomycetota bacterium]|nr:meso-butanediol dehydrogenase / (S,S)-butanediol dehydrogenase / diacetyl reductase [Actinomycetota bacterium]